MIRAYRPALVVLILGLLPLAASVLAGSRGSWVWVLPAIALPIAVLLAVRAYLGLDISPGALVGGGLLAPLIAIAGESLVPVFAYAFLLGFADSGRRLFDALRIDPTVTTALTTPWTLLLLIELGVFGPFIEEAAKALGASFAKPSSRRQAFLAGVTAGCAFAAIEDILYVVPMAVFGGPWPAIVAIRMLGVAVHPLATGLTMIGYQESRERGDGGALGRGYITAVGVHMLWNSTTLVAGIVVAAIFTGGSKEQYGVIALTYAAVLGVALAGGLWQVTRVAASDANAVGPRWDLNNAQSLAAWTLLASTLLVPVSILLLAFPGFYHG